MCNKTFPNEIHLKTHIKTKHAPKQPEPEVIKPKPDPSKNQIKPKGGFEQYQQDLEDKIFAFLGELGEKNVVSSDDV